MIINSCKEVLNSEKCMDERCNLLIDSLCVWYEGQCVIKDVGFPVYKNSVTALMGPSGCGKTSCLMTMNRLIEMVPNSRVQGRILFNDIDLLAPSTDPKFVRRQIGMVFQQPNPFPLSIERNISFALREHGMRDRASIANCIERCLTLVGLWEEVKDRLQDSALTLSIGQQQRLCIARTIALEPNVLLMDEPTSALDPLSAQCIEQLIQQLACNYSVVVVTHNLQQARRIADFTGFINRQDGYSTLVEHGLTDRIFNQPKSQQTANYIAGQFG